MEQSDNPEFVKNLLVLGELFDKSLSAGLIAIYFDALKDLPILPVVAAIKKTSETCKFFPKPVEIRELIEGNLNDRAEEAWNIFWRAASRAGRYASVIFEDSALAEAITRTFGSWPEACRETGSQAVSIERSESVLSDEMTASRRKQFVNNYRIAQRSPCFAAIHLPGIHERENQGAAFEIREKLSGVRQPIWFISKSGDLSEKAALWDTQTGRLELEGAVPYRGLPRRETKALNAASDLDELIPIGDMIDQAVAHTALPGPARLSEAELAQREAVIRDQAKRMKGEI